MSRYYSVLVITVVVINGLHCTELQRVSPKMWGSSVAAAFIWPSWRPVINVGFLAPSTGFFFYTGQGIPTAFRTDE